MASLGHPSKFQRVSRLGSVTAWYSSSGRQPNFAALSRGQGGHHVGHWPTFLVKIRTVCSVTHGIGNVIDIPELRCDLYSSMIWTVCGQTKFSVTCIIYCIIYLSLIMYQWQTLNTCYNYFVFNRHSLMELSQLWPALPKATLVISSAGFYRPISFIIAQPESKHSRPLQV